MHIERGQKKVRSFHLQPSANISTNYNSTKIGYFQTVYDIAAYSLKKTIYIFTLPILE